MSSRIQEDGSYTVRVSRGIDLFKRGRNRPMRDYETWHDENGERHRVNGPALIVYDIDTGVVVREAWMQHGTLHRTDGPALITRDGTTGRVISTTWYAHGEQVPAPERSSLQKPVTSAPPGLIS
jgi:hypothetical protein